MIRLADIVLERPLGTGWLHGLLLFTFAFHFLFVMFTLGTGMLATIYYVVGRWGQSPVLRGWDRDFLSAFFSHKSLAIVLGVGPILLMQMGHSVPFLTGVNLMSPLWMLIIVCLIGSLAIYEWQHRTTVDRPRLILVLSTLALALLLYVPATFVGVVVATERPSTWATMLRLGGQLPREASVHWTLRLLHVLGASAVVTAAFHYMRRPDLDEQRRRHLLAWITGGLAFQFTVGVGLYGSVRPFPSALATGATLVGVACAGLLAFAASSWRRSRWPSGMLVGTLGVFIVIPMLLTRQLLQDRVLYPLGQALRANAVAHNEALEPYRAEALAAFQGTLAVPYDNGLALYSRSCSFCHGAVGNGRGDAAGNLAVPPENLTALRMTDRKLTDTLLRGVPGSAMPVFDFYLDTELDLLREFVRYKVGLHREVETFARPLPDDAAAEAKRLFDQTCAVCHDKDGRGSARGLVFAPPVPDLGQLSAKPDYDFQVISNGYPGTMMRSFADVAEPVRWAVVKLVQGFYTGGTSAIESTDAAASEDGR